jgi:hypothetical protein
MSGFLILSLILEYTLPWKIVSTVYNFLFLLWKAKVLKLLTHCVVLTSSFETQNLGKK